MNKQQAAQRIEAIRAELAELEKVVSAPEKVELEGGKFLIDSVGEVSSELTWVAVHHSAGVTRKAKPLAERAAKDMRRANRLRALRDQLCPEWEADWRSSLTYNKYRIYFHHYRGEWDFISQTKAESPCEVYWPEEVAEQVCEWLNAGAFDLDGGA